MRVGVQFRGRINGRRTRRWFTHSWPKKLACYLVCGSYITKKGGAAN